ncbi:preprotein translocase subunit YajC [Allonocardiopsis opalescens]|uniref:Preprotein translocase subunit YajC n=1 Tax=Allonocardiopsis opalescens TaxID=1144618 RepID=A0A2T0PWX9_9ACTN|nr:preprotein translocase subunit YajC [Allonocardiopsis opalescens]PRX96049.1 preprotein translocase subunit YajC [Allonocardiopsis opalescens]
MQGHSDLTALAQPQGGAGGNALLINILMIAAIFAFFYFVFIRPQRKRMQETAKMQNSLVPGSTVMTTAGMFATVAAITDDRIVLEIAPGVEAEFVKQSIAQVVSEPEGLSADHLSPEDFADEDDDTDTTDRADGETTGSGGEPDGRDSDKK